MKKHYPVVLFFAGTGRKFLSVFALSLIFFITAYSQGYEKVAKLYALNGANTNQALVTDNAGNTYMLVSVLRNNFPVTIPYTASGSDTKSLLVKHDPDGNIIWARYLPHSSSGTGSTTFTKLILDNNILYLLGGSSATDVPVTNGSVAGGGNDIVYATIDPTTAAVITTAYLGGSGSDGNGIDMVVQGGNVFITYTTTSSDIPVTTTSTYTSGYDHIVLKMDGQAHIAYSTYTGSAAPTATNTDVVSLKVNNGNAHLAMVVNSTNNFVTTNGSTVQGNYDFGLVKLDASGNRLFALVYGGTGDETFPAMDLNNDDIFLTGFTNSVNYPVTDGSSFAGVYKHVITKFSNIGSVGFSSTLAGSAGTTLKDRPLIHVNDGSVYLMGTTIGTSYLNTTDGSTGECYLIKLNAGTGQTIFATRFGSFLFSNSWSGYDFAIENGRIYTISPLANNLVVTDGSTTPRLQGSYIAVFTTEGKLFYATVRFSGSYNTGGFAALAVANGKLFVSGTYVTLGSSIMLATEPIDGVLELIANNRPISWAAFEFCPPMPTENTISPFTQSICKGGLTESLTGNKVAYSSTNMPEQQRNGIYYQQNEIPARYQWQVSTSATGPWTNIAGLGTQKDYTPPAAAEDRYYRRLVLPASGCGDDPVSTSAVAAVLVSADNAPVITGDVFNTCIGSPVDISVNVTSGATPYSYSWDNGVTSTTNEATVTPASNTVYTVTVTDNLGCQQAGQVIVNAYTADAGPATTASCAGTPVRIGTAPPAGLAGVTYSWSPVDGLDDPNIAQPLATPTDTTTYTLTMTIPVSGGGTCVTTDDVTVNVIAAPVTTGFAGPDQAVCKGGTLSLGTTAESGFSYTWAPGSYLSAVNTSTVTFDAGSEQPVPNSVTYTLTAVKGGCSFRDDATVSVLEVNAGKDLCGPRKVGTEDKIPGVIGKVYHWDVISGPGTITGPDNTVTTTVSESIGGSTTYRLSVSYLGVTCTDDVVVPECSPGLGCPILEIEVEANHSCPSTDFGPVTLNVKPSNLLESEWTYFWSSIPSGGLSATTGTSIELTDNVERDVTVTVTSVDNPGISCSKTIHVNAPSWSLPVFSVTDHTVCANTPVSIGNTAIAGYSYQWRNVDAGQETDANPTVSPASTTDYIVDVTDDASGCTLADTAVVTIKPLVNDPGSNWTTCSSAVIQLGSPALPGYTYSWQPAAASYQGGTDNLSAQPKVLVATTQDFTLTVTDTETGCTKDSTIHIVVDPSSTLPAMQDTIICAGSSVMIGNPAQQGVTYSWSPATGLSDATAAQPIASPTSTQAYTLTVTYYDAFGAVACTKSGSVTVTVNGPVITDIHDITICPSDTLYDIGNDVVIAGGTGTITYMWSPASLVTTPDELSTTMKANPTTPVTLTLTATDANGCKASGAKTITPAVTKPEAGSSSLVCVGGSIQLGDASNTGDIVWSVSPAIAGTIDDVNSAQPVFTPSAADAGGSYTFTISQGNGTCASTDKAAVTVRQLAIPTIAPQTVCNNASATIGTPAVDNVSYLWTPGTNLEDPNGSTTIVNNVTGTEVYTLNAVDLNGCFATANAVIGVNPTSAPTVTIPDIEMPVGSEPPAFAPDIAPAGTYSYSWSPADKVDNPYIANATPVSGEIGTTNYTLSITDANGCTSLAQAKMTVNALVTLPITIISFKAIPGSCSVLLQWETAAAENFASFIVERSSDGTNFEPVATINYEYLRSNYQYTDAEVRDGNWIYRLKLVDIDGHYKYSTDALTRTTCIAKDGLLVYPNPTGSYVNIKSSKPIKQLKLMSITGNVLMQQQYNQSQRSVIKLFLSNTIKAGIYFLAVWDNEGNVQYAKLLKD